MALLLINNSYAYNLERNSPWSYSNTFSNSQYENAWGTQSSSYNYDNKYAYGDYSRKINYEDNYRQSGLNYKAGYGNYGSYDDNRYLRGDNRYYDCKNCITRDRYDGFYWDYINSYSDYHLDEKSIYYQETDNYKKYIKPHQTYTGPGVFYKYTYNRNYNSGLNENYEYQYSRDNNNFYNTNLFVRPFGQSYREYNNWCGIN